MPATLPTRPWKPALLALATALLGLSLAAPAGASIYFDQDRVTTSKKNGENSSPYWISRANSDGSYYSPDYLKAPATGVAVDSNYIYWTQANGSIGRASLDGSSANSNFITGASNPQSVAVDANYIYWTNTNGTNGSIGRAALNGTAPNQSFIAGLTAPQGVAVDANYVYWTDANASGALSIGRANLNGTGSNRSFITGLTGGVGGVAVNASNIYWATTGSDTASSGIGRANLDGSGANALFVSQGIVNATDVALDSNSLYWVDTGNQVGPGEIPGFTAGSIGTATLAGSNQNNDLITGIASPFTLAVDATTSGSISIKTTRAKIKRNKVKLKLSCSGSSPCFGQLALTTVGKYKVSKRKKQKVQLGTASVNASAGRISATVKIPAKTLRQVMRGRSRLAVVATVGTTVKRRVTLSK